MSNLSLDIVLDPPDDLVWALRGGLDAHNRAAIGDYDYAKLAVVARGPGGALVGGIEADFLWGWMYIQTLWVEPGARRGGVGGRLLRLAEAEAVTRGVMRFHLETTSFQARAFYERHGYHVFGELEGKPPGHTWYYLKKLLDV